jgi:hypothetical protein
MHHGLVHALRARGVDVQTAMEAAMIERTDEDHLAFATAHNRVLCSSMLGIFIASIRATWQSTNRLPASSSPDSSNTPWVSTCAVY